MEISHILYADDTLLLYGAGKEQFLHLRVVLLAFEAVSGLKINLSRSFILSINAGK